VPATRPAAKIRMRSTTGMAATPIVAEPAPRRSCELTGSDQPGPGPNRCHPRAPARPPVARHLVAGARQGNASTVLGTPIAPSVTGSPVSLMTWSIVPAPSSTVSTSNALTPGVTGTSKPLLAWMVGLTLVKT
jgi:hypothetical protein